MSARWGVKFDDKAILKPIAEGTVEGLWECAKDLSERSQRLCPKKRGYNGGLVSTHYEEVDAETGTMTVGYTAAHAMIQHYARRFKHNPGEQDHYLSQPLDENRGRYLEMIARRIRERLSR